MNVTNDRQLWINNTLKDKCKVPQKQLNMMRIVILQVLSLSAALEKSSLKISLNTHRPSAISSRGWCHMVVSVALRQSPAAEPDMKCTLWVSCLCGCPTTISQTPSKPAGDLVSGNSLSWFSLAGLQNFSHLGGIKKWTLSFRWHPGHPEHTWTPRTPRTDD